MHKIVLPGNTISSKRGMEIGWTWRGKKRQPILRHSDAYKLWETTMLEVLLQSPYRHYPWQYPLYIHFHFVRSTRGHFDFINLAQGPMDVMQKAGIIDEDDMDHVVPVKFTYEVDKSNPRLELYITEATDGNSPL